jgi:hypothetical protein
MLNVIVAALFPNKQLFEFRGRQGRQPLLLFQKPRTIVIVEFRFIKWEVANSRCCTTNESYEGFCIDKGEVEEDNHSLVCHVGVVVAEGMRREAAVCPRPGPAGPPAINLPSRFLPSGGGTI